MDDERARRRLFCYKRRGGCGVSIGASAGLRRHSPAAARARKARINTFSPTGICAARGGQRSHIVRWQETGMTARLLKAAIKSAAPDGNSGDLAAGAKTDTEWRLYGQRQNAALVH